MKFSEFLNKTIRCGNKVIHTVAFSVISIIETFYLSVLGVSVGRRNRFRGWVHCFLSDDSSISIGNDCEFNYRAFSNHIGQNHRCILSTMNPGAKLVIGNNVGMSSSTVTSFKSVEIGSNVRIGANCVIMDGDFHMDDPRVSGPQPVSIDDNVWLGYGVIVQKGVHIGRNSVIGANSVVTHDIPENCVAAGSPCRIIRNL